VAQRSIHARLYRRHDYSTELGPIPEQPAINYSSDDGSDLVPVF
jgi:hypothetical protein